MIDNDRISISIHTRNGDQYTHVHYFHICVYHVMNRFFFIKTLHSYCLNAENIFFKFQLCIIFSIFNYGFYMERNSIKSTMGNLFPYLNI